MDIELSLQECCSLSNLVHAWCSLAGLVSPNHLARDTEMTREPALTNPGCFTSLPHLSAKLVSPSHEMVRVLLRVEYQRETTPRFSIDRQTCVNYSLLIHSTNANESRH